jgi:putative FmdB family regulatory protein
MPIYKYICRKCEFSDEYIRAVSDRDTPPLCRKCDSETERIINFSGTVWSSGGQK